MAREQNADMKKPVKVILFGAAFMLARLPLLWGFLLLLTYCFSLFGFTLTLESPWISALASATMLLQTVLFTDLWFWGPTRDYTEDGLLLAVVWLPIIFMFDASLFSGNFPDKATLLLGTLASTIMIPIVTVGTGVLLNQARRVGNQTAVDPWTRTQKMILGGVFIWSVHLASGLLLFPYRYKNAGPSMPLGRAWAAAEMMMPAIVAAAVAICMVAYFRSIQKGFLKQGLLVGVVWLIINAGLDGLVLRFGLFVTNGTLAYIRSEWFSYVLIPIMTINAGYLLSKHSKAADAAAS